MLPWSLSDEAAAEKHMVQLQHNMGVTNSRLAALSVITGGGKWIEVKISPDPLYQHLLLTAEKKFFHPTMIQSAPVHLTRTAFTPPPCPMTEEPGVVILESNTTTVSPFQMAAALGRSATSMSVVI